MPASLKFLEVENFKSYLGHKIFGPLKQFTAIMGPNGSGKSNLMDAFAFVMGEKAQYLRMKSLSDLIHGASINNPASESASVTAVFEVVDDETKHEVRFKRTVHGSTCKYQVDNDIVTYNDYLSKLDKLHVNIKFKNFLVYQGTIESVALKNPYKLTALIEEISGSGEFKEKYDRIKEQLQITEEELTSAINKKKILVAERNKVSKINENTNKYLTLKDALDRKLSEQQLFRLFHIDRELRNHEEELTLKQTYNENLKSKKQEAEEVLKNCTKELSICEREHAKIKQNKSELEEEIKKTRSQLDYAKQNLSYERKKLDDAIKTLEQTREGSKAHSDVVKQLQEELAKMETERDEYKATIVGESQSKGQDVHLEPQQFIEYNRLKEEAVKLSLSYMKQFDIIDREQITDQNKLDVLLHSCTDTKNKLKQKNLEEKEMTERANKLQEIITSSQQALDEQKQKHLALQSDVDSSTRNVEQVQQQLHELNEQLRNAAEADGRENAYQARKQNILQELKSNYNGVYDRVINLCRPIHKKYNIAITKVFGSYMNAIVVDTELTGRQCIGYLKNHKIEPETFLPIDILQSRPLNTKLRDIKNPTGVKLLFDVIKFEPEDILKAILFITKNTLVCETPEVAMEVAYRLSERHNVVALNGNFYQKSGIISGGSLDLSRKAKRWDQNQILQLKSQRETLTKELCKNVTLKESQLNIISKSQIDVFELEGRLKLAKNNLKNIEKEIESIQTDIKALSEKLLNYEQNVQEIKATMQSRQENIDRIQLQISNIEDGVFSQFCQEIGVTNIRQYEDCELKEQDKRAKKLLQFQNKIDHIHGQLQLKQLHDKQILDKVNQWQCIVNDSKKGLESWEKTKQKERAELDKKLQQIEPLNLSLCKHMEKCNNLKEKVNNARKETKNIAKQIQAVEKLVMGIQEKIDSIKYERHNIFVHCMKEGIDIPKVNGDAEYTSSSDPSTSSPELQSQTSSIAKDIQQEDRIQIDYDILSDELKVLEETNEIKRAATKQSKEINKMRDAITKMKAPNMKVQERYELLQNKLKTAIGNFESALNRHRNVEREFMGIQNKRAKRFDDCFKQISAQVDGEYKSLMQDFDFARAYLQNGNYEPYLYGTDFNCLVPGKGYHPMSSLSGGEKTVAALALLFAIQSYRRAPFFVLDEVDAALDSKNITNVIRCIKEKTKTLQMIVISLKDELLFQADLLIGVWSKPGVCTTSQISLIDLTQYPE